MKSESKCGRHLYMEALEYKGLPRVRTLKVRARRVDRRVARQVLRFVAFCE